MRDGSHTIVFNADKTQTLLVKRRDMPVWVFPGGGIEKNESPEHAAVRETFEESGYEIKVLKKIGQYKTKQGAIGHLFEGKIVGGKPTLSSESCAVNFFPLNKLPQPLSPSILPWLQDSKLNSTQIIEKPFPEVTLTELLNHLFTNPNLVVHYLLVKYLHIHWDSK